MTNDITCSLCAKPNPSNKAVCNYCGAQLPALQLAPQAVRTVPKLYDPNSSQNPREILARIPAYPFVLVEAVGLGGQLQMYADRIRIMRQGTLAAFAVGLKGDKDILISSITSIQFKKCGDYTNGYIQFGFIGGAEAKGALLQATTDENTVMFTIQQQPYFEWFRDCLETQRALVLAAQSSPHVVTQQALSPLDELEKLATLRDKGIVTDAEFEAKKKQLLNL